jgi:hypothetical protein
MLETRRGAPPVKGVIQICERLEVLSRSVDVALSPAARDEVKATDFPSGDQRGEPGVQASPTSSRDADLPSVLAIQIDGTRRLRALSILDTIHTACRPSGEICGSDAK